MYYSFNFCIRAVAFLFEFKLKNDSGTQVCKTLHEKTRFSAAVAPIWLPPYELFWRTEARC